MKSDGMRGCLLALFILSIAFCLIAVLPTGSEAALDVVLTYDSDQFMVETYLFASDSMVYISASDGASVGGTGIANVTDEMFGDNIQVLIYDDGSGPGDMPGDGSYTGVFTVVDDEGISGQYTDDIMDIMDLADGGSASVEVDLDMTGDSGIAMVTGDFKEPTVNITSASATVDQQYTLTATVTDVNMDTNAIWYTVDGGQSQQMAWIGADQFEALVNTSALLDGSHTLRVVAYDVVNNVNNSQIVIIDVHHPAPDIDIFLTITPTEPKAGDRVTFEIRIDNSGDADAEDVTVSLLVDGEDVDNATETILANSTETVILHWNAEEGTHQIEVEVIDGGARLASTPTQPLEIELGEPLIDPMTVGVILVILAVALIGGTIGFAYYGRDLIKGARKPNVPAEEVPPIPPEEEDPCEEIRRKWRAVIAEYARAEEEMESSKRRADTLRESADQEWREVDEERENAEEAKKPVIRAEMALESAKQEMSGYFANNLMVDGISVDEEKTGLDHSMSYFRGVVTVHFRSSAYEEIIKRFISEYKHVYDELQEDFDKVEKELRKRQAEAGVAEQKIAQAEVEARKAENVARQAEQEHEILKQELENLKEQAEAYRQEWRMCNLKRLSDATERIEGAVEEASEAEREAQDASGITEYEDYKKKAESAKSRADQAKGDAEAIKNRLKEEDMDEDLEEYDDRIGRALSDIGSVVERIVGFGVFFRPEPGQLGQPCKGDETMVLDEYTMQYQLFDPSREISMPEFYALQSGGEAGEALSEYLKMVADICQRIKDVVEVLPEGPLVGIPIDYWPTIMDATGGILKKNEESDGLGFIKMGGLTIPTIQITVVCREIMVCRDGTWQKERERFRIESLAPGKMSYPKDDALPFKEAIGWIQSRLEKLKEQQRKFLEAPCA